MTAPSTRLAALASFVTHWIDPIVRPFAGMLPGFCVLTHVGRRSGRVYRTPLNVFRRGDRATFALTYGSGAEWVRNVLAAGQCDIRTMRRELHLVRPEVVVDPQLRDLPWLPRVIERTNRVSEILVMRVADPISRVSAHERRRVPVPGLRPPVGEPVVGGPATRIGHAERNGEVGAADHRADGESRNVRDE